MVTSKAQIYEDNKISKLGIVLCTDDTTSKITPCPKPYVRRAEKQWAALKPQDALLTT